MEKQDNFETDENNHQSDSDPNLSDLSDPSDNEEEVLNDSFEKKSDQKQTSEHESTGLERERISTPPNKQSVSSKNSRKSSHNYFSSKSSTLNIKHYKSFQENDLYPVNANSFLKLETLLFDALDFKNQLPRQDQIKNSQLNENEKEKKMKIKIDDLEKLNKLDNSSISFAYINDMNLLNERLKFDDLSNKFKSDVDKLNNKSAKTNTTSKSVVSNSFSYNLEYKNVIDDYEKHREKFLNKAKLITIVLNESNVRPRKSGKILVSKKQLNNFDSILNEISNLFRIDYTSIKRLYDLNGIQITDCKEILDNQIILLFIGNDKIYGKDFDLDPSEIELYFANQPKSKKLYLQSLETAEQEITESRSKQQSKLGIDRRITSTDDLLDNYEVGHVIGQGHYALVRECKDINTGIQFALKIIDLNNIQENDKSIENELKILRKVKHTNIVKLVEEFRSSRYIYLIMEYLKDGDLLEAITQSKKYSEKESAGMIRNIACALSYLHSLNIVHRDVKLENILIHKYSDGSAILKLGDFGLAIELDGQSNEKCGSPIYVAPEVLQKKNYGLEVDVWSLGIIGYILLCGFAPFQGSNENETFDSILNEQLKFPSPHWDHISLEAIDLIKKMLDRNQSTRITINEVIEHEWINLNVSLANDIKNKSNTNNTLNNSTIDSSNLNSNNFIEKMSKHDKNYNKTKNVLAPTK